MDMYDNPALDREVHGARVTGGRTGGGQQDPRTTELVNRVAENLRKMEKSTTFSNKLDLNIEIQNHQYNLNKLSYGLWR